jgi:hypothetical protein
MSTHQQEQVCTTLIAKLTLGHPLNASEKAHLSQCIGCMRDVIRQLDRMAEGTAPALGGRDGSSDPHLPNPNPEVIQALEHGRRVFAREFGL